MYASIDEILCMRMCGRRNVKRKEMSSNGSITIATAEKVVAYINHLWCMAVTMAGSRTCEAENENTVTQAVTVFCFYRQHGKPSESRRMMH